MRVLIVGYGFIDSFRWVVKTLTEQNFVVETADSGMEALEKAHANPPEIVACYRLLPDGLGVIVADTLHKEALFAETRFIVEFYVPQLADDAAQSRRERAKRWPWIYHIEPPASAVPLLGAIKRVANQENTTKKQEWKNACPIC